ncbi:MAG TPA: hypothetical protein VFQ38_05070 [Longimicrobiales bacterium]|nr:hypothetical protein [Longimicrobiales bacterium]
MSRRDAASSFRGSSAPAARRLAALAAMLLCAVGVKPAEAQRVVSVPVTLRVAPVLRVEEATSPEETARTAAYVEYRTLVRVSANLGYELRVSAAPEVAGPVLVRGAGGAFEASAPGTWVSVLRRARPCGGCAVEVVCRLPASAVRPAAVPLRFQLVGR